MLAVTALSVVIPAKGGIQTPVAFGSIRDGAPMDSGLCRNDGGNA